ncbi:PqqD family protein [Sutcliffiella horikoshii]|uniref:PqqD family protein n=1 Tax=Sutcliffiella horikoshii TaxID=79883 RepID=UPI003CF7E10C
MENNVFKQSINFRIRDIAKKSILIGDGEAYYLNSTAICIWDNIDGQTDFNTLVRIVEETFESKKEINKKEIENFIKFLIEKNAVELV